MAIAGYTNYRRAQRPALPESLPTFLDNELQKIEQAFRQVSAGGGSGTEGPQGPQGPAGPAGPKGDPGVQGPAGAAGPSMLPLVTGEIPPVLVYLEDGSLIGIHV